MRKCWCSSAKRENINYLLRVLTRITYITLILPCHFLVSLARNITILECYDSRMLRLSNITKYLRARTQVRAFVSVLLAFRYSVDLSCDSVLVRWVLSFIFTHTHTHFLHTHTQVRQSDVDQGASSGEQQKDVLGTESCEGEAISSLA